MELAPFGCAPPVKDQVAVARNGQTELALSGSVPPVKAQVAVARNGQTELAPFETALTANPQVAPGRHPATRLNRASSIWLINQFGPSPRPQTQTTVSRPVRGRRLVFLSKLRMRSARLPSPTGADWGYKEPGAARGLQMVDGGSRYPPRTMPSRRGSAPP